MRREGSGSISQRYGSVDPDPHPEAYVPKCHGSVTHKNTVIMANSHSFSSVADSRLAFTASRG